MGATDQMIARYVQEIEERQQFIDGIFTAADGKDLSDEQLELVQDTRKRMELVNSKIEPLIEMRRISGDSATRVAEIAKFMQGPQAVRSVEYRSAGEWTVDYIQAALGSTSAKERIEVFTRAAAHQTTADNPGLLPDLILGPIISFVDETRPLVGFFGPRQLPQGSWSRPQITQHTQVAAQAGEKTELVSRKMIINKLAVTAKTLGGYVNLSRQDADWTNPAIMDILIQDLSGQYAIATEADFATTLFAAATAETAIPTGAATAAQVSAALWTAVGNIYTVTKGQGRLFQAVSPDMLGLLGPLFAPINPTNSQSSGFNAADIGSGSVGAISGVPVIVSPGLAAGSWLVGSTAAAEAYEDRIGPLQVLEPSVLGTQLAYAGYWAEVVLAPTALRKIAKTP